MTEFKEGDRVKVTRVFEGTVEASGDPWLQVRDDHGGSCSYNLGHPNTTVEKIIPPMPEGQILYAYAGRAYAPIPDESGHWRNLVTGAIVRADVVETMWRAGDLSTVRPASVDGGRE